MRSVTRWLLTPTKTRRLLFRLHVAASYVWAICYAAVVVPAVAARAAHSESPMAAMAGAALGFLLAPVLAPFILLGGPIAAAIQHRPLSRTYWVALAAYLLTAAILYCVGRWRERREGGESP